MKKIIITAISTAILISSSQSIFAVEDMEKCEAVKDGKGIIKANKGDCKTAAHSCAGQNPSGEKGAFIIVPIGKCKQINKGDFSNITQGVKDKLDIQG